MLRRSCTARSNSTPVRFVHANRMIEYMLIYFVLIICQWNKHVNEYIRCYSHTFGRPANAIAKSMYLIENERKFWYNNNIRNKGLRRGIMPEKNYKAELVGVFGHPVSENPTIVMQEAAFKALDLNYRYLTIEVRPEDLEAAMEGLRACNFRGINLTIPHKVEVLKHLDGIAEDAKLIGAVNTVYLQGGKLYGENTDGKGFLTSLREEGEVDPIGKNVVVLGAGGAARAITVELALAGAGHITVVNRSEARGRELTALLNSKTGAKSEFVLWNHTYAIPEGTDILVNSTSIGLFPNVNEKTDIDCDTIKAGMTVCDVIPNHPHTMLLKEAEKRGAKTLDGLGMLVNQGVIGFKMWTGVEAPAGVMREALEKEFGVGKPAL